MDHSGSQTQFLPIVNHSFSISWQLYGVTRPSSLISSCSSSLISPKRLSWSFSRTYSFSLSSRVTERQEPSWILSFTQRVCSQLSVCLSLTTSMLRKGSCSCTPPKQTSVSSLISPSTQFSLGYSSCRQLRQSTWKDFSLMTSFWMMLVLLSTLLPPKNSRLPLPWKASSEAEEVELVVKGASQPLYCSSYQAWLSQFSFSAGTSVIFWLLVSPPNTQILSWKTVAVAFDRSTFRFPSWNHCLCSMLQTSVSLMKPSYLQYPPIANTIFLCQLQTRLWPERRRSIGGIWMISKSLLSLEMVMTKQLLVGLIWSIDLPATPPEMKKSFFETATTDAYSAKLSMRDLLEVHFPSVQSRLLLDQLDHEELQVVRVLAELREDVQKASLVVLDVNLLLDLLLGFVLLGAAVGAAVEVEQGDKAGVANVDEVGLVLPALRVQLVPLGDVGVLSVLGVELVDHLLRDHLVVLAGHCGDGLAGGLDLVLVHCLGCVCGLQERKHVLDVAVGGRDEDLLQVLDDLVLPSLADLAELAVHEGGAHLVAALLADLAAEGHVVVDRRVVEALDVDLVELAQLVLAELAVPEVLLDGVGADDAGALAGVGVLDDLGALVADLAELRDAVHQADLLVAVQLHLVRQALLEVVAAERGVLIQHFRGH